MPLLALTSVTQFKNWVAWTTDLTSFSLVAKFKVVADLVLVRPFPWLPADDCLLVASSLGEKRGSKSSVPEPHLIRTQIPSREPSLMTSTRPNSLPGPSLQIHIEILLN
jgi:hypothetical protein